MIVIGFIAFVKGNRRKKSSRLTFSSLQLGSALSIEKSDIEDWLNVVYRFTWPVISGGWLTSV